MTTDHAEFTVSSPTVGVPDPPPYPTDLYIGGRWVPAERRATFEVDNPATGEALCQVADASIADGVAAVRAAAAASSELAATTPAWRSGLLRAIEAQLRERSDEIATLITLEMGKPLAEAIGEVAYAADFFGWFADEAKRISGDFRVAPQGASRIVVQRRPVGVCLLITPWNFPLAMAARKIAPAIAAGCASVLKPAEQTPLTSLYLAQLLDESGLPGGAVNVVTTTEPAPVVEAMIGTGIARKLSFTGSTSVGKLLLAQCARRVMRTSMELGGNAPFIVFDDADLDAAVDGAVLAKMRNMGEACTAANRIFVQASVAEAFVAGLAARLAALRVGPGWLPTSDVGPLIDDAAVAKVRRLLRDAVERGATVETGGDVSSGRFVPPTLLSGVPEDAALFEEEIFGPLAAVTTFETEEEVVARANDTVHGLISYAYTRDLDRAMRMLDRLDSGMIAINAGVASNAAAPFGGTKESGLGREGGFEGLDEYLDIVYGAIAR